jgi:hypothetical protein
LGILSDLSREVALRGRKQPLFKKSGAKTFGYAGPEALKQHGQTDKKLLFVHEK